MVNTKNILSYSKKQLLASRKNLSMIALFIVLIFGIGAILMLHASATTSGQMKLYFHKEASDVNETYNAMSLTPPEAAADTAPGTLTSSTAVNATPPTSFCESTDGQTDAQNERVASAAAVTNVCLGTFISMPVGNAISMSTSDTNAITSQLWSSESATQATVALNVYLYRWTSGTTVTSGNRIATLTCADPGSTATSCTVTATPANNITFAATDRIIAIVSSNVTGLRAGADTRFYFDSSARTAASVTLKYTALGYNTSNKPGLTGSLDDDFTTAASTTACSSSGVSYSKWLCLQGTAASTAGAFNAEDTAASGSGDSSSWLWLRNQTTATTATTSNFGTTPSNTFLYQSMPSSYGDGNISTVVNSTATFGVGASTPTTPFNHVGLVLWTSNTDYLELQVYSTAATTGTNSVNVAMNNSGTIGSATSLNSSTTSGIYGEVWLRITNTSSSFQAQYSTDGTTWNNVGSAVSHSTAFTRVGLNAFDKIANPVSTYAGAFEWFQYNLAPPTYNQTDYRWLTNANSATPGAALASLDTAYTLTSTGQQFRLRQLLHVNGNLAANPYNTVSASSINEVNDSVPRTLAIASDGFARMAISDNTNLTFMQCTNNSCSSKNTTTVSTTDAGTPKLAMGSDNFARILYEAQSSGNLHFVQCTNASCSTKNDTVVDSGVSSDSYALTMAASDGFARIAYRDSGNNAVKFAQCTNAACSTNNLTTVDSGLGESGPYSIALGSDGFARIVYGIAALKLAQCTNASCSTKNLTAIDSTISPTDADIAMASSDGFARISYRTNSNTLKFAQCTNAACSTNNLTTVDSSTTSGFGARLALDSSDFAKIAYDQNGVVKLVSCTNAACSSSSTSTIGAGQWASIVLGSDSFARMVYYGFSGDTNLYYYSPVSFKLQFAAKGSACSSASYSDVTSSSSIAYYNNATPKDEDTISSTGSDPTESGQTVSPQTYQEVNGFMNTSAIGGTVDGEWDFSLFDNGATSGTSYCFRIATPDGSAIDTYTQYPVITTFTSGPTIDQEMRGGNWFNNGTEQGFYWAN